MIDLCNDDCKTIKLCINDYPKTKDNLKERLIKQIELENSDYAHDAAEAMPFSTTSDEYITIIADLIKLFQKVKNTMSLIDSTNRIDSSPFNGVKDIHINEIDTYINKINESMTEEVAEIWQEHLDQIRRFIFISHI